VDALKLHVAAVSILILDDDAHPHIAVVIIGRSN